MLPSNKAAHLRERAAMLAKARQFFLDRKIMEVDCPLINAAASVDAHIDLIPVIDSEGNRRYLHSSPEYGMKRLLSIGVGDIYQMSHVFRQGECGKKHNPEFMMAEWYRVGMPFADMIQETLDFIRLFLGDMQASILTYRDAMRKYAGIDYVAMSAQELYEYIQERNISLYEGIANEGKDQLLNILLATMVEPQLGSGELCALSYFPATQSALAQTQQIGDERVAERFEVYYQGIELCNGYHELIDPTEQRRRLNEANIERIKLGKDPLPIDELFLKALESGIPDACGVAVGVDRLMMLRLKAHHIADVIPFAWNCS